MVEGTRFAFKAGIEKMNKHSMVCAGIDTGKHKLDVALEEGSQRLEAANSGEGHGEVSAFLRRHRVKRVGIEASGGYEQAVVQRAAARRVCRSGVPAQAGSRLCVVSPEAGQERQDRCRADRVVHGGGQEDPCPARSPPGALCRAADADRSADRPDCAAQDLSGLVPR